MSKEQTPIEEEITNILNSIDCFNNGIEPIKDLINAKVLEALEREVPKAVYYQCSAHSHSDLDCGTEYYETEVKPKYK